jgi:hypothetical protein
LVTKAGIVRELLKQSPFLAFPKDELEKIDERWRSKRNVFVRFGYQWKDERGNSQMKLSIALRDTLRKLCAEVSDSLDSKYKMNYARLRAQVGKPVLHKIVFDILSADILFFDVSQQNLNVFFELGIGYAANQNLFLMRRRGTKHSLPSDLDGLTYCTYEFGENLSLDSAAKRDIKSSFRKVIVNKTKLNSND